jgi:hypothetical protein
LTSDILAIINRPTPEKVKSELETVCGTKGEVQMSAELALILAYPFAGSRVWARPQACF